MSKRREFKRVSLRLDPGLVLERLILSRLGALSKSRHEPWLRSLLVQGYVLESRVAHHLVGNALGEGSASGAVGRGVPRSAFASWLRSGPPEKEACGQSVARAKAVRPSQIVATTAKPFASLRNVIG